MPFALCDLPPQKRKGITNKENSDTDADKSFTNTIFLLAVSPFRILLLTLKYPVKFSPAFAEGHGFICG
jgi:hypothetical protein